MAGEGSASPETMPAQPGSFVFPDATNLIYERLIAMMADVEPMKKLRKNPQQGFMFRGIDDIYDAMHPLLVRHKIFVAPIVEKIHTEEYQTSKGTVMHRTILTVAHRFTTTDGSYVSATTVGESSDAGDKSAAKAMSVAFKYALFQTLCIPLEEPDPDAANPDGPGSARAGGKNVAGRRIGPEQKNAIWAAAAESAKRLEVDRSEIARVVFGHFNVTATDRIAQTIFNDVLELMKQPDELLKAKAEEQGPGEDE